MRIQNVSKRGILFTFNELNKPPYHCTTNIYVIVTPNNYIVCDTYLGDYYIKKVKSYLLSKYGQKSYIVFNSHSHWDHIWGNESFGYSKIIAHELCKNLIEKNAEENLLLNKDFQNNEVKIVKPNTLFNTEYQLKNEGITFFHSPGHSEDSCSCYDEVNNALFVADNIERPFPSFISWDNLDVYIKTLKSYLAFSAEYIVLSHGDVTDKAAILDSIKYLTNLKNGKHIEFSSPILQQKHLYNIEMLKKW